MIRLISIAFATLFSFQALAQVPPDGPGRWNFPQVRVSDGYSIVVHAPQVRSWPDFERFTALAALEVTHPDGKQTDIGAISVAGDTTVDLERRLVLSSVPKIENMFFEAELSERTRAAINGITSKKALEIPLDLFLAQVSDSVLAAPPPEGFNFDAPPIHVVNEPAIVLIVGGDPVLEPIENNLLQRLVNANWPVFREGDNGDYYLLFQTTWLQAAKLEGPWRATQTLPAAFGQLPDEGGFRSIRAALPPGPVDGKAPKVIFATKPAELIVIDGPPELVPIAGADGLNYLSNTASPLFERAGTWYYLVAGRWFATEGNLFDGSWKWRRSLPSAFNDIPEDIPVSVVRASIPGTPEAKMATLEASLPTKKAVAANAPAPIEVGYAGDPMFEPIPNTELKRAANSGQDVIEYNGKYYLCYAGAWYSGPTATGPWVATGAVPKSIYSIPPSSPSYHVTQVTVQQITTGEIVYVYPPSYTSGVFIVYGVAYYGTGWYYPPWAYGGYYYPYPGSYGYGNWYNPNTGRYGSRSVYYGPYGGSTYTSGYNSRTGRYSETVTGWDGDEWGSYRETYNPRTGISSQTERHYDADSDTLTLERSAQRGNTGTKTTRTIDFDDGASYTKRETSRGGESNVYRNWGNGKMTTTGDVRTADGRTATIQGSYDGSGSGSTTIKGSEGGNATVSRETSGGGVSREGSFSRDGKSVTTQTQRSGAGTSTTFQTSGGATGKSVSAGVGNRMTVGKSSSGDLYAATNGQVYKASGDKWESFQNGKWGSSAKENRSAAAQRRQSTTAGSGNAAAKRGSGTQKSASPSSTRQRASESSRRSRSQLDRDRQARQASQRSYERRRAANSRARSGGFGRSRGAGGGSRGGFGGGRGGGRRR